MTQSEEDPTEAVDERAVDCGLCGGPLASDGACADDDCGADDDE